MTMDSFLDLTLLLLAFYYAVIPYAFYQTVLRGSHTPPAATYKTELPSTTSDKVLYKSATCLLIDLSKTTFDPKTLYRICNLSIDGPIQQCDRE